VTPITEIDAAPLSGRIRALQGSVMLATYTVSFLKLIDTVLDDVSHGVASGHHLHNVRCGIENILALLEWSNDLVEKADQLSHRADDYITYRALTTSQMSDRTIGEDVDRLRIAREALAGFRSAVELSRPNSRVRALGLA
jgi:hypothetical protein